MKCWAVIALLLPALTVNAKGYFVGYDLGEMALNEFKNFSGEFGYSFANGARLKLAHMDVIASEEHLSSDFAQAVDGANVTGVFKGYEVLYVWPIYQGWYWGGSVGYYREEYTHTILNESVGSESPTLGMAIGYREDNLWGFKHLYYDLSIPFRYSFNGFETTTLGRSTVTSNKLRNNIWFNVGIQF